MLLVLITVAAMGMSRNALRELIIVGTARQGAMARNTADSGIEWAVYWIEDKNAPQAAETALKINNLKAALLKDDTLAGVAKDITSSDPTAPTNYVPGTSLQTDLELPAPASVVQGFTVGLTRMGKLPITNISQGAGSGAFTPASGGPLLQAPDLWAIRSDAQVTQGNLTFIHAKEAWVSTPVK
jgi:hypothetical protein